MMAFEYTRNAKHAPNRSSCSNHRASETPALSGAHSGKFKVAGEPSFFLLMISPSSCTSLENLPLIEALCSQVYILEDHVMYKIPDHKEWILERRTLTSGTPRAKSYTRKTASSLKY